MRPTPRARHLLAVLILACVAAATGYLTWSDQRLDRTQIQSATAAVKRQDPGLYPNDPVFGPLGDSVDPNRAAELGLWQFHTPVFQGMMELVLVPTGYRDPSLPFRLMAPVVTLVYLLGMYALLYRQTRSWSLSLFVAAVSSGVVYAIDGSFWGVGSLNSISPAGLCVAVTPLVLLAFLRYRRQWWVALVFGFVGILGNLHPQIALCLGLVLLMSYLCEQRFRPGVWPRAAACVACGLLGALPYALYCYWLRAEMAPAAAAVLPQTVHSAMEQAGWEMLYPEILREAISWPLFFGMVVLPGAIALHRLERYSFQDLGLWLCVLGATIVVTYGFGGVAQAVGLLGSSPPVVAFVWASALAMAPLCVLFTQALVVLFRLGRGQRGLLRWGCVLLAVGWIAPTDNFRTARYALLEAVARITGRPQRIPRVERHRERSRKVRDLAALAHWASQNTDRRAVFICDSPEFRLWSRRSIVASSDDMPYYYHFAPWRLADWTRTISRQSRVLFGSARPDPNEVAAFVRDLTADPVKPYAQATEWYVLYQSRIGHADVDGLELVSGGEFYQLYQYRPAAPDPAGPGD